MSKEKNKRLIKKPLFTLWYEIIGFRFPITNEDLRVYPTPMK